MDKLKDNLTSRREIAHLFSYKASEASETRLFKASGASLENRSNQLS